jgi:hypothetical protein
VSVHWTNLCCSLAKQPDTPARIPQTIRRDPISVAALELPGKPYDSGSHGDFSCIILHNPSWVK